MGEYIITATSNGTGEETIIAKCFDYDWAKMLIASLNFSMGNMFKFSMQEV